VSSKSAGSSSRSPSTSGRFESLAVTASDIEAEVQTLEARREPARIELDTRRDAGARAIADRDAAAETLQGEEAAYADRQRNIEGLEADVEAARSEVFAAVNASTALRHAMEHATGARTRLAEQIGRLDVERRDLDIEIERATRERNEAESAMRRALESMEGLRLDRATRESELAGARTDRDARLTELRSGERDLAGLQARLQSLEELAAARAEYGDGARRVLAESNGNVSQMGSVADYLDVDNGYERAVEACLGDLLQHVVVPSHEAAAAGLQFVREHDAGRVGFLVAGNAALTVDVPAPSPDLTSLLGVVRVDGPAAAAIRGAISTAWIAPGYQAALNAAEASAVAVVTLEGEVFRGPHVVQGGMRAESRGILTTRREIKELRDRVETGGRPSSACGTRPRRSTCRLPRSSPQSSRCKARCTGWRSRVSGSICRWRRVRRPSSAFAGSSIRSKRSAARRKKTFASRTRGRKRPANPSRGFSLNR